MKKYLAFFILFLQILHAQTGYKLPPKNVVDIIDAKPTPTVSVSPRLNALLLVDPVTNPPVSELAKPILRIGGIRISPHISAEQRISYYTGMSVLWLDKKNIITVDLPAGAKVTSPRWSHDGKKIAFLKEADKGIELWIADALTGKTRKALTPFVNDILDTPFEWMSDNSSLVILTIPPDRGPVPTPPATPFGPSIEETAGKIAKTQTFQDLLKNPFDETLFEYYGLTQIGILNSVSGKFTQIGKPGLYTGASLSPDEKMLLVRALKKPFSYRVPYSSFPQTTAVWDLTGKSIVTIADLPVADQVPTQGVPVGPRRITWYPMENAALTWIEALDGGDPMVKAPFRDKLMYWYAPFTGKPVEAVRLQHRCMGYQPTNARDEIIVTEMIRERRWRTVSLLKIRDTVISRSVLFDLSVRDAYNDPGNFVYTTNPHGKQTILQEGDWAFLSGRGATEKGERPFLDKFNLKTKTKERLFQCGEKSYEQFISFTPDNKSIITRFESQKEVPNYFLYDLKEKTRTPLTAFKDPAPQMTAMKKELLKYQRSDGVPLSGTLYLPPGYVQGTKLPLVIWAYPMEYSDAATAGQIRSSPDAFTFFRGTSQLFFVTQGYAVLNDATMPVVGDPETMNNTFVDQIVGSAKAAIDKLDSMGVIDRKKVLVGGHSYGAFMTVNLLAHSDLFAAGIARSGAYNRTLTPFGFQSERRSFWEAPDVYMKVSPFMYADKIKKPLLIFHGEADNNTGTFPIQSERLFQAMQGTGGTARLVILPHESHGYSGRESVLHVLAESFEWADKYLK